MKDQDREINALDSAHHTRRYGTSVKLGQAQECFDLYVRTMAKYRVTNTPTSGPIDPPLVDSPIVQLTTREIFRGKELKRFLRKAARQHSKFLGLPSPINTSVRVVLGICTPGYAKIIDDSSRIGRICLFLATGKFDDTKAGSKSQWSLLTMDDLIKRASMDDLFKRAHFSKKFLDGDDDVAVFDFGGLEP